MRCPRCEAALAERERDGVTIDICASCRGIWLDRGELEKLIARASAALDEAPPSSDHRHRPGQRRKRSWFESLGDVFD
ncbi:MAG: zf-TFIIB domain-containing protein [Polyangiaceae bacterium]|nr:zf-TFIIB domain-containing protein [Polyangiaceae bacterium]